MRGIRYKLECAMRRIEVPKGSTVEDKRRIISETVFSDKTLYDKLSKLLVMQDMNSMTDFNVIAWSKHGRILNNLRTHSGYFYARVWER